RFRILEFGRARQAIEPRDEQTLHHTGGRLETAVQVDRTEHRLERIRKNRLASKTARLELARPQAELVAEPDLCRDDGKRLSADEARAEARQIPLVGGTEFPEHEHGNDAVEHRIAEELEPLVVRPARAAVCQGRLQQCGITALVPERLAHPLDRGLHSWIPDALHVLTEIRAPICRMPRRRRRLQCTAPPLRMRRASYTLLPSSSFECPWAECS